VSAKNGDFCIDFHQRFDLNEGHSRLRPDQRTWRRFFVEDPVRTEAFAEDLPILRRTVKVPLAAGEEWGNRWDFNKLVEAHDIDFVRATLPNVGGHHRDAESRGDLRNPFSWGIVPHFTGPIATAALVNCLGTFSGPVLMEYNYQGRTLPHLPVCLDFKNGKLSANDRPGLGVELDMKQLKLLTEITQAGYETASFITGPERVDYQTGERGVPGIVGDSWR